MNQIYSRPRELLACETGLLKRIPVNKQSFGRLVCCKKVKCSGECVKLLKSSTHAIPRSLASLWISQEKILGCSCCFFWNLEKVSFTACLNEFPDLKTIKTLILDPYSDEVQMNSASIEDLADEEVFFILWKAS